jgi:Tfp pilus assembly protein PilV
MIGILVSLVIVDVIITSFVLYLVYNISLVDDGITGQKVALEESKVQNGTNKLEVNEYDANDEDLGVLTGIG